MGISESLRKALANTFGMYYMAHAAHWNVKGDDFAQMHEFFGDLYEEVYGAVDPLAEHLRAIGSLAPMNLATICSSMNITEMSQEYNTEGMIRLLQAANRRVIDSLNVAYEAAYKNYGLQNFLADRLDQHAKHGWMLAALLDTSVPEDD